MKIWGRNTSSNVQKVMWAVGELGLAHERIDLAGRFGGNREPAYLAKNPNGLVPTIETDDGFVMWESNAIVRFLAAAHGEGSILPADLHARARADQWMDWQVTKFAPAITPVFFGLVRTPPEKRDEAVIAEGKAKCIEAMTILDAALCNSTYVAGSAFSFGDIPLGVNVRRFLELVTDRPPLPNLERWFSAISARPAFREHVASIPLS
ncbi:glutathione S-transferase family protein [Rhodovulum sp. PH10]|uniref:glutathione S-transferase family protein n=1 Tax=Rhodovulum sp. PH10 TaxID=1187851 RepID=UPI00058E50C3|nr:glutathione S-transferase family protein [Rhodovulum sp. PH10]